MLDQSFVAGLGNYLRSEILHQAGVHPSSRPKDLSESKIVRWGSLTKAISMRSYVSNGLTVSDDLAEKRKRMGERRRSYRHSAFCRNGLECHVCGDENLLVRMRISGRRLDMCPSWTPGGMMNGVAQHNYNERWMGRNVYRSLGARSDRDGARVRGRHDDRATRRRPKIALAAMNETIAGLILLRRQWQPLNRCRADLRGITLGNNGCFFCLRGRLDAT